MNQDNLTELVTLAQSGDADAMEQLLFHAHTPVSHLCRKLLQNDSAAEEETREILRILSRKLNTLQDPALFEKWILRITAARCMQLLPQLRWGSEMEDAPEADLGIAGQELDAEQTADAIQAMVDTLPEEARVCLLLYCCTGMNSRSIAQVSGYTQEAVRGNLARGQALLQEQLEKYQETGTEFSGITSLADILRSAIYRSEDREAALPMVYGVLGKEIPVPPDPTRWIVRLLTVIVVLLLVVFLGLCGLLAYRFTNSFLKETPAPTTEATLPPTTAPTETTAVPTESTTAPTETPTVPTETTEATEEATIAETTEATKETAPKATSKPAASTGSTGSTANTGNSSNPPSDAPQTGEDGHTHRYLTTRTNFNCETGGHRNYLCADCDYYYTVELSPSGTHNFITVPAGPMGSAATCTKPGTVLKLCNKCNVSSLVPDPDSQPALGHSYTDSVVAPSVGQQGYTLHTCSRCGDSYQDNFVEALPAPAAPTDSAAPPADDAGSSDESGAET